MDATDVLDDHLRARLRARYLVPERAYHTFAHAATVARHAADLGGDRACILAAWFHDAVYEPGAADNERRSAALLLAWLGDDPDGPRAAALVRTTADHRPSPGDRQAAVLSDADLAVLGGSEAAYDRYRERVRREFSHVDDERWRVGRTAVLADLLDRTTIFATEQGRARWEQAARRNLTDELRELSRPG